MALAKSLNDRYPVFLVLTYFHKMPFISLGIVTPIEIGATHVNSTDTYHLRFNQSNSIFEILIDRLFFLLS